VIDNLNSFVAGCERFAVATLIVLLIATILCGAGFVAWSLVVQTALIALCNRAITLNLTETKWTTIVSVTGLILALTAASYVLERGRLLAGSRFLKSQLGADSGHVTAECREAMRPAAAPMTRLMRCA
jgi:hypothetical protein